jgi:DNA-binding FadR family transcriptional regulator
MRQVDPQLKTALLDLLGSEVGPVGARQACALLAVRGVTVSEATVGRWLRDFDSEGWTVSRERKGRELTEVGRRKIAMAERASQSVRTIQSAIEVSNAKELLDLLEARRTVERSASREAARRATPEHVREMHRLIVEHEKCLAAGEVPRETALLFHRFIADLSTNQMLKAMASIVLAAGVDHIEAVLDLVIGSHHSEQESVIDHVAIAQAIAAGDGDTADGLMNAHLGRLIGEVERYMTSDAGQMIDRLITWSRTSDASLITPA